MAKQLLCQKYILKLNSSRLRKARWKLSLPLEEAMKNKNDLVALGSSQVLRFLDELHGRNTEEEAQRIKKKISLLHKATPTAKTKKILKGLYQQLYELQYQPNYVAIIMDKLSDYDRLNKGFSINHKDTNFTNIYRRLLLDQEYIPVFIGRFHAVPIYTYSKVSLHGDVVRFNLNHLWRDVVKYILSSSGRNNAAM